MWGVQFVNPGFNQLALERILKKKKVTTYFKEREVEVSYTYIHTVRKKSIYYKYYMPCLCEGSSFTHEALWHVCTGNLAILED